MLINGDKVNSVDDLYKELDRIRSETMFKDRDDCLHIIRLIVYEYGVNAGKINAHLAETMLHYYENELDNLSLERLAAIYLNLNDIMQNR